MINCAYDEIFNIPFVEFDDMSSFTEVHSFGFHWSNNEITDIQDSKLYLSDNMSDWESPWLEHQKLYIIEYRSKRPIILNNMIKPFEPVEEKINIRTCDMIVYIPKYGLHRHHVRQSVLLNPVKSVIKVIKIEDILNFNVKFLEHYFNFNNIK